MKSHWCRRCDRPLSLGVASSEVTRGTSPSSALLLTRLPPDHSGPHCTPYPGQRRPTCFRGLRGSLRWARWPSWKEAPCPAGGLSQRPSGTKALTPPRRLPPLGGADPNLLPAGLEFRAARLTPAAKWRGAGMTPAPTRRVASRPTACSLLRVANTPSLRVFRSPEPVP